MAKVRRRFWVLLILGMLAVWSAPAKPALVDINSASLEELETLPGVREPLARSIMRGRPYANKGQLLSRKIVSPAQYKRIRDLIIAHQESAQRDSVHHSAHPGGPRG